MFLFCFGLKDSSFDTTCLIQSNLILWRGEIHEHKSQFGI
ncbi:hypothetical protein HHE014_16230 [Helicobacter heilmannii]|nr:hypothetical protein HHE014_16230 [Helicobacter heilmannii]